MRKTEKIYDEEIAPQLLAIAERCRKLGFSIIVRVEFNSEKAHHGRTEVLQQNATIAQKIAHWAARCNANVDALMTPIMRYAEENGQTDESMVLYLLKNIGK
jgi:hypothetical protein